MNDKLVVRTYLEMMGTPVPVDVKLADNATKSEREAWNDFIGHAKFGSSMNISVEAVPAKSLHDELCVGYTHPEHHPVCPQWHKPESDTSCPAADL